MARTISIAIALMVLAAAPNASFAAKRGDFSDPSKCTGGACTAANPDRIVNRDTGSYYKKKSTKKHTSSSSTNR